MPSTYAHYVFGQNIYRRLTGNPKNIVGEYPQLYNIGLHGPDIFFYYKPLSNNPVNTLGFRMHNQPASDFFTQAAAILQDLKSDISLRNGGLAYILGFICHFALDSTCHGYIENKIRMTGITHTEIETEFDRYLMVRDHLNPVTHHLTDHIHPARGNAQIIQIFFRQFSQRQIQKTLASMVWYNDLLVAPGPFKRHILSGLMKLSGKYPELHGLFINKTASPKCSDSCLRLDKLMDKASARCLALISNYMDFLYDLTPLDKYFARTFGPEMNWQSIPVYSYQEELNYEI